MEAGAVLVAEALRWPFRQALLAGTFGQLRMPTRRPVSSGCKAVPDNNRRRIALACAAKASREASSMPTGAPLMVSLSSHADVEPEKIGQKRRQPFEREAIAIRNGSRRRDPLG